MSKFMVVPWAASLVLLLLTSVCKISKNQQSLLRLFLQKCGNAMLTIALQYKER